MTVNANGNGKLKKLTEVIRSPCISTGAKAVFALLFTYADSNGNCWPGIERMARELNKSKRWVIYHLNELCSVGVIQRNRIGKRKTNVYEVFGEVQYTALHKSEVQHTSPGEVQKSALENGLPPYSDKTSSERSISSKNISSNYSLAEDKSSAGGKKKTKSKNSAKEKTVDIRVNPTLRKFYEAFKANIGAEPPKTAFDWGRDGRRVKELPADYTEGVLAEAIERFFQAPAYVRKNYRFADFLAALPRLIKNDFQEGGKTNAGRKNFRPPAEPSKDWSDWES